MVDKWAEITVPACVSVKLYSTKYQGDLAKWRGLQFIAAGADCFIMLSPLDKTICALTVAWLWVVKCVNGYISVCVFPHFQVRHSGSVIHLFHSPNAIVIALVQSVFCFIRHLFLMSSGLFSFIRASLERQCKAARCHWVPPGEISFHSVRVISRQSWDRWGDLRWDAGCMPLSCFYSTSISKHPMPIAVFEMRQNLPSSS